MRFSQDVGRAGSLALGGLCALAAAAAISACGPAPTASTEPFRSYNEKYKPPASEYDGPLFELSQDYPTEMPAASERPDFFETDFRKDWRTWMMQGREYCLEGNTEVDWRVQDNDVRSWYHMPWQDFGSSGREAIHGLTQEAPVQPLQLAPSQKYKGGFAYAVGVYNDFGAYTIGQVWKDHSKPDPEYASTKGFPIGTVVCKPLFLNVPPDVIAKQIPWLKNPVEWHAYTNLPDDPHKRAVQPVTLVQLDIMARDDRSPTGWIFGTFQYNGELDEPEPWDNLAPVGLMWGNDPDYAKNDKRIPVTDSHGEFPAVHAVSKTPINKGLEQTIINPDRKELPPTHLGWDGRLNGPLDNSLSSCFSCHMTASFPNKELSPLFTSPNQRPTSGTPEWDKWWMQWFQNVAWTADGKTLKKFMDAKYALDLSLQLSDSIRNFYRSEKDVKRGNVAQR